MESDSKLKSFSHFLKFVWSKEKILSPAVVTEFCGSERETGTDIEEISDPCLLQALLTVRYFYDYTFRNSINNDKTKYSKSGEELIDYIKRMCNDARWFGRPTIFERCFATIYFVLTCSEFTEEAFSGIKRHTLVSWHKYFCEYTKEFYNEGGWKNLSKTADSYAKVHDLIRIVNLAQDSLDFTKLSKSVENYMYFCLIREFVSEDKNKSKVIEGIKIKYSNKCKTCASLWIKFKVQKENNSNTEPQPVPVNKEPSQPRKGDTESFDASCIQPPKRPSEVTCLLRALRNFCDPYGFKADNSKSAFNPGLPQKSNDPAICLQGRNQESATKNEKYRKGASQANVSHKNSDYHEAIGQEFSNSIIKNVSPHNATVEKEGDNKDTNIENFKKGENEWTNNVPCTTSTSDKTLKKSNKRKIKRNEAKLQDLNKGLELNKATGQASSNSSICSVSLQKTAVGKGNKDNGKSNFIGVKNERTDNVPCTSSTPGEMWKKYNKPKWNRTKAKPRDFNKSLELSETTRQAPNSIVHSVPLQNTVVGKEHKDIGKSDFIGKNDGMNNLPNPLSMAGKMGKNRRRKQKKAGLQDWNKNLGLGEAATQESGNSNNTHNNVSVQNTAFGKENDEGNSRENVAKDRNDRTEESFVMTPL